MSILSLPYLYFLLSICIFPSLLPLFVFHSFSSLLSLFLKSFLKGTWSDFLNSVLMVLTPLVSWFRTSKGDCGDNNPLQTFCWKSRVMQDLKLEKWKTLWKNSNTVLVIQRPRAGLQKSAKSLLSANKNNSSNRRRSKESFWPIRRRPENFEIIFCLFQKNKIFPFFLSIC